MNTLILKLGATGDVVRTTPLLTKLSGEVTWITAAKNLPYLQGVAPNLRCFTWEERESARDRTYDLVIGLEDTLDVGEFIRSVKHHRIFGAHADGANQMVYTKDSHRWFDLSLISTYGRKEADRLKLLNRHTYQELIFDGLGFAFKGEKYFLPRPTETGLTGDVAIAAEAGPVWPMKNWAYYGQIKTALEAKGLRVNVLPKRATLLEHLCDVRNHRCLVGGDSLPMHLALGTDTRSVTIFNCTSPWEIHDYGILEKIISPLLSQYFYRREFDPKATTAIGMPEVLEATLRQLQAAGAGSKQSNQRPEDRRTT